MWSDRVDLNNLLRLKDCLLLISDQIQMKAGPRWTGGLEEEPTEVVRTSGTPPFRGVRPSGQGPWGRTRALWRD